MAAGSSKRRNLRTALVLLTIAGVFFLGIMVKVALFGL
ncbi:MAG: cytochrome oxidase small assembly protein [Rhodocyclaceae bacterium]|nr:cytochrome oxidase small assembly protein [Rhodocyclaceae bacterium]